MIAWLLAQSGAPMNQLLLNQLLVLLTLEILAVAALVRSRKAKSDKRWMPDIRRVV
jgi:hypothetical protein